MFRFGEDAFLRKGGDYSRNCLTFEEEEQEAVLLKELEIKTAKVRRDVEEKLKNVTSAAPVLFVSAGGRCTEPIVRAMFSAPTVQWIKSDIGDFAIENEVLIGFVGPSTRRPKKDPISSAVDYQQLAAREVLKRCKQNSSTVVILATTAVMEQPDDYTLRVIKNSLYKEAKQSGKVLEEGRLVTTLAAAFLESATLAETPCVCFLAPREPVLAIETLDCFHNFAKKSPLFAAHSTLLAQKRKEWTLEAIKSDEQDARRYEPEGMFM